MMGPIFLGLSLPMMMGAAQAGVPEGWKEVSSKDGKFKAAMPAEPMEKKQVVKTATGQLTVKLLVAEGRDEAVFVVSYTDYPEAALKKGAVEKRLDQARDGAVSSSGGKLNTEQAIKINNHPGRHLTIEKDGKIIARMRIYLVNRRLYQVMVLGGAPNKDVSSFLSSFELIE